MINADRIHIGPSGWHQADWVEAVSAGASPREHRIDRLLPFVDLLEIGHTAEAPLNLRLPGCGCARPRPIRGCAGPPFSVTASPATAISLPARSAAWKAGFMPLQRDGRLPRWSSNSPGHSGLLTRTASSWSSCGALSTSSGWRRSFCMKAG